MTVGDLKQKVESYEGTVCESQRLSHFGKIMSDHRTLESYGLAEKSVVLLLPHLASSKKLSRSKAPPAPRGLLMVPGTAPWKPQHHTRIQSDDLEEFFDNRKDLPWE